jgi:hypothetical protein
MCTISNPRLGVYYETMKLHTLILPLILVALVCAVIIFMVISERIPSSHEPVEVGKQMSDDELQEADEVLPYGEVTSKLGELVTVEQLSLRVLSVVEDSRCPLDVTCIQAGTVRVLLELHSSLGVSTQTVALGETRTTEVEKVTFQNVTPHPVSKATIPQNTYTFTFSVEDRVSHDPIEEILEPAPRAPLSNCYVGGCSSQLCTDTPDAISTCEYRESYACYQGATCERQASGQCGWTQTPQLQMCLSQSEL